MIWQRKRRLGPGLQIRRHTPKWTAAAVPLCGAPLKDGGEGKPSRWQNSEQHTWLFILLGIRNGQRCDGVLIHRLWPVVWLDGQGLGRNRVVKLMTRSSGKVVCG